MTITGAEWLREYETDGVPSSGPHKPKKSDGREWTTWVEASIASQSADITRYGAIEGGTVLVDAAIRDALAANEEVYIGPGVWLIGSQILVPSGRTIRGAGEGITIIKCETHLHNAMLLNVVHDVRIYDLTLDGVNTPDNTFTGAGTNPTLMPGYGSTKLWLDTTGGGVSFVLRGYAGTGSQSDVANWPEVSAGGLGIISSYDCTIDRVTVQNMPAQGFATRYSYRIKFGALSSLNNGHRGMNISALSYDITLDSFLTFGSDYASLLIGYGSHHVSVGKVVCGGNRNAAVWLTTCVHHCTIGEIICSPPEAGFEDNPALLIAWNCYANYVGRVTATGYRKGVQVKSDFITYVGEVELDTYLTEGDTRENVIASVHTECDGGVDAVGVWLESGSGKTCTITNASPAVVTCAAHGLVAGDEVHFDSTGALPTGMTSYTLPSVNLTRYYVIATGLSADTFQFSATVGGAAINTSSSGSGTHTLKRSFNTRNKILSVHVKNATYGIRDSTADGDENIFVEQTYENVTTPLSLLALSGKGRDRGIFRDGSGWIGVDAPFPQAPLHHAANVTGFAGLYLENTNNNATTNKGVAITLASRDTLGALKLGGVIRAVPSDNDIVNSRLDFLVLRAGASSVGLRVHPDGPIEIDQIATASFPSGTIGRLLMDSTATALKVHDGTSWNTLAMMERANIFTNTQTVEMNQPAALALRNTASLAAGNVVMGSVTFRGNDSASNNTQFASISAICTDYTDGSEDAQFSIVTMIAGTLNNRIKIGAGLFTANATGGDKGADTINAITYFASGTQVVSARETGYAAMTGTANKNTTYDTSTVTLAQLAGRVMALQASLTTHGLIGA